MFIYAILHHFDCSVRKPKRCTEARRALVERCKKIATGNWFSAQEIGSQRALRFLLMRGRMFLRFAAGNEQDERKQDDRKDETGDKHIVQGAAKHAGEC